MKLEETETFDVKDMCSRSSYIPKVPSPQASEARKGVRDSPSLASNLGFPWFSPVRVDDLSRILFFSPAVVSECALPDFASLISKSFLSFVS